MPSSEGETFYNQNTDPSENNPNIAPGTIWYSPAAGRTRVFVDRETSDKHLYFGNLIKTSTDNIEAHGQEGGISPGYWIRGSAWVTRSPDVGGSTAWIRIYESGGSYSSGNSTGGIVLCFSI